MERMSRVRSLLLLAGIPLLTWQIWLLARPYVFADALHPAAGIDALAGLLAWALYLSWAWLAFTIVVAAGEALVTGRLRHAGRLTPRVTRRFVAAMCGLGVLAAGGTAQAADLNGLPMPDRVVGRVSVAPSSIALPAPAPSTTATAPSTPPAAGEPAGSAGIGRAFVTVRQGDCLWSIAYRHHTSWRAIYDLNRHVIGDDPDLIFPGQRLVLP